MRSHTEGDAVAIGEEISRIEVKAAQALQDIYGELTPWQKTQVARHPQRPHCLDYISALITDFVPLAGDRKHGEDAAIIGGFGRFRGDSVCVIGHEKGSDTESRLKHNFGMARPEGYRKAARLMGMADHFDVPVIALIDTAGAYPGIGAEERGQAEAIARSTEACLQIGVPNVAVIIGEGGSGGAIAIATANRVLMLEHAIYSVISPGGRGFDPVARYRESAGSRFRHEDHRPGSGAVRRCRFDRIRADWRSASRPRRSRCCGRGRDRRSTRRIARARPGDNPPVAPREVFRHRSQSRLMSPPP